MAGRPTKYTKDLADKICLKIATSSQGLSSICEYEDIAVSTVFEWLKDKKEFSEQYARAREAQADFLADEIIELADTYRKTEIEYHSTEGSSTTTQDNVARSKLQIDARKWKASKLAPKKYGDKVDVTSAGEKLTGTVIKWGDREIEV
jgi:hypothetical protein